MGDSEKIAAALRQSAKEPQAFERFYVEHSDPLLHHFTRKVGEAEAALDLTAETLAQAFLSRGRFRGSTDAEAGGWLYGIARRKLAMYHRRGVAERRALGRLGLEPPRPNDDFESRLIEQEAMAGVKETVRAGLDSLSGEQREAVRLRFIEELPYSKIADGLGVSEEAARARVARGLRGLRIAIGATQPTPEEGST